LYRHASGLTATTRPFCRHIDAIAGEGAAVHIPNGALDLLVAREPAPLASSGTFTVGYTGNLGIAQGLGIVLDAADRLRDRDVRFRLIGDGPLRAELAAEIARRDLENVELRRAVPVLELPPVLDACDALLVPLRAEPMLSQFIPSKLYDAMAAGRPVLLAATGESAAIVNGTGCGLVVGPEDGAELAQAVERLAADRTLARHLGAAGRAAAGSHARSCQLDQLESVLRVAISSTPSAARRRGTSFPATAGGGGFATADRPVPASKSNRHREP
jgi:glycosyltransferase involved in cell wall biosynthesis